MAATGMATTPPPWWLVRCQRTVLGLGCPEAAIQWACQRLSSARCIDEDWRATYLDAVAPLLADSGVFGGPPLGVATDRKPVMPPPRDSPRDSPRVPLVGRVGSTALRRQTNKLVITRLMHQMRQACTSHCGAPYAASMHHVIHGGSANHESHAKPFFLTRLHKPGSCGAAAGASATSASAGWASALWSVACTKHERQFVGMPG
eukprot:359006-Chlamydomonas_euryale.AAC.4